MGPQWPHATPSVSKCAQPSAAYVPVSRAFSAGLGARLSSKSPPPARSLVVDSPGARLAHFSVVCQPNLAYLPHFAGKFVARRTRKSNTRVLACISVSPSMVVGTVGEGRGRT